MTSQKGATMDSIKTYDIEYTLKNKSGKTATFSTFPAHAYIEARTEAEAKRKLEDEWWSWVIEIHSITECKTDEMSD